MKARLGPCLVALGLAAACGQVRDDDSAATSTSGGTTSAGGAPEGSACADGSMPRPFVRDADGDGTGQKLPAGETCDAQPPSGHTFQSSVNVDGDCDDTDPALRYWANFYTDADADGYGVPNQEHTFDCAERAIAGMAPNARDCDDSDASAQLEQFVDADADGYGVTAQTACVADDAEGYTLSPDDCDDSEASVHPYSEFEAPLDGVDSDCDGNDYPITRCADLIEPGNAVPVDETCEGAVDLFLASVSACHDCEGSRVALVVGNRGTVATGAELVITGGKQWGSAEPLRLRLEAPLAPGALSPRLESAAPRPEIFLEIAGTEGLRDCNPTDNQGHIDVGFVDCL